MNGHVTCECKQSGKLFFTDTTAVLLTSLVTQYVSMKAGSACETFVAYLAWVHVVSRMNIKVTFELKGARESFVTYITTIYFIRSEVPFCNMLFKIT